MFYFPIGRWLEKELTAVITVIDGFDVQARLVGHSTLFRIVY